MSAIGKPDKQTAKLNQAYLIEMFYTALAKFLLVISFQTV